MPGNEWRVSPLFLLGAAVSLIYVPWVYEDAIAPRWALIDVALPAFLVARFWNRAPKLEEAHAAFAAFLAWAALSLLWSPVVVDGAQGLWLWSLFAMGVFLGYDIEDIAPLFRGALLGIIVSSIMVAHDIHVGRIAPNGTYPGIFGNKDLMGEAAAMILVAEFAYAKRWNLFVIVAASAGLYLSTARSAALGVGAAFLAWVWTESKLLAVLIFCLTVFAYLSLRPLPIDEIHIRLAIYADVLQGLTWMGNGVGSFWSVFPLHETHSNPMLYRIAHAHDDPLEIIFTLGLPGFVLLAGIVGTAIWHRKPERYILVVVMVAGLLDFPLFNPLTSLLASVALGRALARGNDPRFTVARRRLVRLPWLDRNPVFHSGPPNGQRIVSAGPGYPAAAFARSSQI